MTGPEGLDALIDELLDVVYAAALQIEEAALSTRVDNFSAVRNERADKGEPAGQRPTLA